MTTTDMSLTEQLTHRLRAWAPGVALFLPGEEGFEQAATPWNVAVRQRPAAVAVPRTVEQAAQVVRAAGRLGLRVAAQNTGHGAAALAGHDLAEVVVIRMGELRGVHVDAVRRVARVEGGAIWGDVVAEASRHGLVALHGSSPGVGVVGYSLGGGLSFYARRYGLAASRVLAVELITWEGDVIRADERNRADLLWALRGGGGNFGVVTALEMQLFEHADAYAGMLVWDIERAADVVRAWAEWCAAAPEDITTSLRVMRFPPLPELPDFLRGRSLVIIDGACLADDVASERILAPLRALDPEMDTFARVPAAAVSQIHMDPEDPTPSVGSGTVLRRLDPAAVEAFLAEVGAGVETPVFLAELRQAGGALTVASEPAGIDDRGAVPGIDGSHVCFFLAIAATPEMATQGERVTAAAVDAMGPWSSGRLFLNLAERPASTDAALDEPSRQALHRVRADVDPQRRFQAAYAPGEG